MRTTLKDIAEDTGLSVSTISRVLARKGRTNSTNEQIIIESANKLHYPFIRSQMGHISQGVQRFALVIEMAEGEFYPSLYNGISQAGINCGAEISLVDINGKKDKIVEFILKISSSYDGICIFLPELADTDYEELKPIITDTPIISLAPIVNPVIDTVTFDGYRGGYAVARHFEEMGFSKVGLISGPRTRVEALYRKNGFLDHIAISDSLECVWRFEGDYSIEAGHEAYADLKKHNLNKIAIFGSNDQTCFGFMKSALEDGNKIPDDIAIAGYDDLPLCRNFLPELTSVNTDFFELGKAALQLLGKKLQGQNDSHGHLNLIPVSINIRTSTFGRKC